MNVLLLPALLLFAAPQSRIDETIEVRRIIVDTRVLDINNEIITDLQADDFRVLVDGKEAPIESVSWIGDEVSAEEVFVDEDGHESKGTVIPPPGRLFVLFVQTDFARNSHRVVGEMGVIASFHAFVEMLQPNDRVALLSFDSHLKLRLDFTTDRAQLERMFPTVLAIDQPPPPQPVEPPSLAALLDPKEMLYAPTSERALILIARALRQVEGPKHLLLLGWGMGDRMPGGAPVQTPDTLRAAGELAAARVTVCAFNFGLNGQLSVGLMKVAADTGGFYSGSPAASPLSGMEIRFLPRLEAFLYGHYEIEIRSPVAAVAGKLHRLDVRVKKKGLTVIAKRAFVDLP